MAEKIQNHQRMSELQQEVVEFRVRVPQYVASCMEKERQNLAQNLKEAEFKIDAPPQPNMDKVKKSYITNSLSQVRKPQDLLGDQMRLNAKTDALMQCIQYLKK